MELSMDLDGIQPQKLLLELQQNNYRVLNLYTESSIQNLSLLIFPIISILQKTPLLQCYIFPKKLKQPLYNVVALGGTFDYLHIGHQLLLLYALQLCSKQIIVGITGNSLLSKKRNKSVMQAFQTRQKNVQNYIKKIKPELIITLPELTDPYGPTITRQAIDIIVVSPETIKGAHLINQIRIQKQYKQLEVAVCKMVSPVSDENIDQKISSSSIRQHILEKNRMGEEQFGRYRDQWEKLLEQIRVYLEIGIQQERFGICRDKWWENIIKQYSQYWRHYHTNRHIYDMLSDYNQNYQSHHPLQLPQKLTLKLSIWFHDLIYNPTSPTNQQNSAELAQKFLSQFQQLTANKPSLHDLIVHTKSAIISTKTHKTQIHVQKLLIDIDMGILNSEKQRYCWYAGVIRKQYQPSTKGQYPVKRRQFLSKLDPSTVFYYQTDLTNLHENIKWEINLLDQQTKQQL